MDSECVPFIFPSDQRWYLVGIFGTSLSVISLCSNLLTAFIFLQKRHAHFFFLGLLAASDTIFSVCYGPVIVTGISIYRYNLVGLARVFRHYVFPLIALCHVSMTFSCLMIILGSIERYLITVKSPKLNWWRQHRKLLAFAMLLLALLLRGTEIFEFKFEKFLDCTGIMEFIPMTTDITRDYYYGTVFRFYFRNIMTVFVPFILLAYLNIRVVRILRSQQRSATTFQSSEQLKIQSATRLLVVVVFSYLIADFFTVFITAWGFVDMESTYLIKYFWIYELLTDIISVMYIFTCATRMGVYVACNEELRKAYFETISRWANPSYLTLDSLEMENASTSISDKNSSANLMHRGTDSDGTTNGMVITENLCAGYHNWSNEHATDKGGVV